MLELGYRQNMTGMETKRARGKCIANALVCQLCWTFLLILSERCRPIRKLYLCTTWLFYFVNSLFFAVANCSFVIALYYIGIIHSVCFSVDTVYNFNAILPTLIHHGLCGSNKLLYKRWALSMNNGELRPPQLRNFLTDRSETQI